MTRAERPRRVLVAVLLSLAFVTGLVGIFAVWVNRQALNTDNWAETSGKLLANKHVQSSLGAYLVDQLFTNVDVPAEIQERLPPQARALAAPVAAGLQEFAGRAAPRVLASAQVQDAWRESNRLAHKELLTVLNDGGTALTTTQGTVTLNLRPLVDQLAARIGIEDQVGAARAKLQLPPDAGRLVIMRSDQLGFAQSVAKAIRHLAVVFTVLPLLLFALAIASASGWRRVALRRTGWCFLVLGFLVLLGRRVGGNAIVDSLVATESAKPAVHAIWAIGTSLLYDIAVAMVFNGVVLLLAAWLAGATRPAFAIREALAPVLRYRLVAAYGALTILFLLLLAWGPAPYLHKPLGILLFAALLVLGVELWRRQIAREFPEAQPLEPGKWIRSQFWDAGARVGSARRDGRFNELEQLASLHDRGVLSDDEYESQKTLVLNDS